MTGNTRLALIITGLGLLMFSTAMAQSDSSEPVDPELEVQQSGRFIWADLVTGDAEMALGFYRDLFNWEIEKVDSRYFMASHNGRKLAGIAELPDGTKDARHTRWVPYVSVNDPDDFAAYASENGGEVLLPPKYIEGRGRFALLGDPEGAVFGVLNPASGDPEEHASEIGNWVWLELWGNSPGDLALFYSRAGFQPMEIETLDGKTEDVILGSDGKSRAGIRKKTDPELDSTWLLYIQVSDLEQTIARAEKLGGVLVIESSDIQSEYPVAVLADPTGGVFAVAELATDNKENK